MWNEDWWKVKLFWSSIFMYAGFWVILPILFCSSKIIPSIISVPDILRYFNKNFGMNVGCQNFPGSANREESAGFWNIWNAWPALEQIFLISLIKKIFFRKHFCTSWLLGIKFTQQISYELATKFNFKFEKIKETLINKFVLKNLGQRIEAKSEVKILVLKRNELANW